jgi:hypothetical protein
VFDQESVPEKKTEIPNETELYTENVQGIFRRAHFHIPTC